MSCGREGNGRVEPGAEVISVEDDGWAFSLSVSWDEGADSVGAMGSEEGIGIKKRGAGVRVAGVSGMFGTANSVCAI